MAPRARTTARCTVVEQVHRKYATREPESPAPDERVMPPVQDQQGEQHDTRGGQGRHDRREDQGSRSA